MGRGSEADKDYLNAVCPISVVENTYSILNRKNEEHFQFVEENPYWSNRFLAINERSFDQYFSKRGRPLPLITGEVVWSMNDESLDRSMKIHDHIEHLVQKQNAAPAQISLVWSLNRKPYMASIPGMKKRERLAENAGAANIVFTSQEMEHIEELVAEYHAQEKNPNA